MGMLNSSSEAVVVTEQGTAIKTRAVNVRRIPESERRGLRMEVTMHSTFKSEWRGPLRFAVALLVKC